MNSMREDIERIYRAAITVVNPQEAIHRHLTLENNTLTAKGGDGNAVTFNLPDFSRILVVGAGKATAPMARAVEDILGNRVTEGAVVVKYGYTDSLAKVIMMEAAHPVPDEKGVEGAMKIRSMLEEADENTLVISLISGGGSALLALPAGNISLEEKQEVTSLLLKSGASIHEMNAVRKHISAVKGGNLARAAYPATVLNLMISDVVGDNMDVIASGPFVPDSSTYKKALDILDVYSIRDEIPVRVKEHLENGADGKIPETPKKDDMVFTRVTNMIAASNIMALLAAENEARTLGYNTVILSSMIEGDTTDAAAWHTAILRESMLSSHPVGAPACIISGGETTVKVTGEGLGGRNMEFALQMAARIHDLEGVMVASVGTDGTDGPTDAAGAISDETTVQRGAGKDLSLTDCMERNDSYHYFETLDDLVKTGPTNTNVMDVRIMLYRDNKKTKK